MRTLRNVETNVRRTAAQLIQPRTRTAFLRDSYPGYALQAWIQFNDPRTGTRGSLMRASIKPGLGAGALPEGTPVTVIIKHGRAEIVGLGVS